jgi:diacylglycerol kinase family enzyme
VRLLLLVNASASSVTARTRVVIQKALSADHDVSVAETSRRGHATHLAQGAAAERCDAVIVLGGDGTLNEAVNGVVGTDTALGVLPGGSTNVFARTIGMQDDAIEATGQLLTALGAGSIKSAGLGCVNGRYFLFHTGIGFDAAVVERVERRSSLKRYAGHALFVSSAVSTYVRGFDRRHPAFSLRVDQPPGPSVTDSYFTICFNTSPYTYLGIRPLDVAPGTSLDTPLTLVSFRGLHLRELVPTAAAALGLGGAAASRWAARSRKVVRTTGVQAATVEGFRPVPYQVDGDYLGETRRLDLSHAPDAVRLILP